MVMSSMIVANPALCLETSVVRDTRPRRQRPRAVGRRAKGPIACGQGQSRAHGKFQVRGVVRAKVLTSGHAEDHGHERPPISSIDLDRQRRQDLAELSGSRSVKPAASLAYSQHI